VGAAAMGPRDRLDDRQAEPGAVAAAGGIAPAEALEGAVDELGREAGAAILDVDLDLAHRIACPDGDLAGAVLEGVLDQVGERLLEAQAIALDREAVRGLDDQRASGVRGTGREALPQVR